jgi:hypothetical protein
MSKHHFPDEESSMHATGQIRNHYPKMKNAVFCDVMPSGSCKNRRFGELSAFIIRVTRICELGTILAVTSNRRTLRRNTKWQTSVLTGATWRNFPEDGILHRHHCENLKSSNCLKILHIWDQRMIVWIWLWFIFIRLMLKTWQSHEPTIQYNRFQPSHCEYSHSHKTTVTVTKS